MLAYALCILLGIALAVILGRLLLALVRLVLGAVGVALAGRVVLLLDDRLATPEWSGAMIVGALAGLTVIVLGYVWIHNALVDADLRRQLERDRQQAAARRI